jgi:hypothetical protein
MLLSGAGFPATAHRGGWYAFHDGRVRCDREEGYGLKAPQHRTWTLIGPDGLPFESDTPGTLGGHRRNGTYGQLDCPGALRWIARGHYVRQRVFFRDEATAIAAGYRPCHTCLRERYHEWKADPATVPLPGSGRGQGWGVAHRHGHQEER